MAWKRPLIGLALTGLVAGAALIAALYAVRSGGPTPEEALALHALALPDGQGDNAFDALWLLEYPVPEPERAAIVAADARLEQAWLNAVRAGEADLSQHVRRTVASGRYPRQVPDEADLDAFCPSVQDASCLAHVRARAEAVDAVLARHAPLLDRIEALQRYGHLRSRFPDDLYVTLPTYQHILLARTRDARRFSRGEALPAMDALCRRAAALRRLAADSDQIIFHLIALRGATDHDARLFADMLAELPAGMPVPPACDAAFAPMSMQEADGFCRTMQGEFALMAGTLRRSHGIDAAARSKLWRLADWFVYDPGHTIARVAVNQRAACAPELAHAILDDGPIDAAAAVSPHFTPKCLANYVGCRLADVAGGPFYQYARRLQDARARVALLGAVVALRRAREPAPRASPSGDAASGHEAEAAFARVMAELKAGGRNPRLGDDGRRLRIDLFGGAEADARRWEIPLPPVLWPQAEHAAQRSGAE